MGKKSRRRPVRMHPLLLRSPQRGSVGAASLTDAVLLQLLDAAIDKIYIIYKRVPKKNFEPFLTFNIWDCLVVAPPRSRVLRRVAKLIAEVGALLLPTPTADLAVVTG